MWVGLLLRVSSLIVYSGDHSLDEHAFELAERYQDFQSLAGLCTKDGVFPPEQNPHRVRIEQYTEQYKEAFAMLLYDQYLGRGKCILSLCLWHPTLTSI
jgi:hypothetical protein